MKTVELSDLRGKSEVSMKITEKEAGKGGQKHGPEVPSSRLIWGLEREEQLTQCWREGYRGVRVHSGDAGFV